MFVQFGFTSGQRGASMQRRASVSADAMKDGSLLKVLEDKYALAVPTLYIRARTGDHGGSASFQSGTKESKRVFAAEGAGLTQRISDSQYIQRAAGKVATSL